jgi:hypothetical protein
VDLREVEEELNGLVGEEHVRAHDTFDARVMLLPLSPRVLHRCGKSTGRVGYTDDQKKERKLFCCDLTYTKKSTHIERAIDGCRIELLSEPKTGRGERERNFK